MRESEGGLLAEEMLYPGAREEIISPHSCRNCTIVQDYLFLVFFLVGHPAVISNSIAVPYSTVSPNLACSLPVDIVTRPRHVVRFNLDKLVGSLELSLGLSTRSGSKDRRKFVRGHSSCASNTPQRVM